MQLKKECTLLELVQQVGESTLTDIEVVTIVAYLVNSGRVRLCGNFAGAKISLEPSFSPDMNAFLVSSLLGSSFRGITV
jgi:hypothetical protein